MHHRRHCVDRRCLARSYLDLAERGSLELRNKLVTRSRRYSRAAWNTHSGQNDFAWQIKQSSSRSFLSPSVQGLYNFSSESIRSRLDIYSPHVHNRGLCYRCQCMSKTNPYTKHDKCMHVVYDEGLTRRGEP